MSQWLTLRSNRDIPAVPGCYIVCAPGAPLYVGSTINLFSRLTMGHRVEIFGTKLRSKSFGNIIATVKVKPSFRYGEELMTEVRLIRRLRPKLNKARKPPRFLPMQLVIEWKTFEEMEPNEKLDYLCSRLDQQRAPAHRSTLG
jgi:excinuclease UvrABC nuclease subunit